MRAPGYKQLTGNPARLHGSGVQVVVFASGDFRRAWRAGNAAGARAAGRADRAGKRRKTFYTGLERLLIAGDAHGGIIAHGHAPEKDALWAALLVLHLCAVRQLPVGELWRSLQQRVGSACTERLRLNVPAAMKLPLVNRYIQHYEQAGKMPFPRRISKSAAVRWSMPAGWKIVSSNGRCEARKMNRPI